MSDIAVAGQKAYWEVQGEGEDLYPKKTGDAPANGLATVQNYLNSRTSPSYANSTPSGNSALVL